MSTCKFTKNDYIANRFNDKELYFVVGVKEFDVVLRRENSDDLEKFTDDDLFEMETHEVNNKFVKVNYDTWKLLYSEKDKDADSNS